MAVAVVHVRSWQAAYRGLVPDDFLDGLQPGDRAARYTFGVEWPRTIVVEDDTEIGGFATAGSCRDADAGPATGELWAIYLDPSWWGRGAGRELIVEARRLLATEFSTARLWVLTGNAQARAFYEKDGWKPEEGENYFELGGVQVGETRYRRDLSAYIVGAEGQEW